MSRLCGIIDWVLSIGYLVYSVVKELYNYVGIVPIIIILIIIVKPTFVFNFIIYNVLAPIIGAPMGLVY